MNRQPTLTDGELTMRPLTEDDRAGLLAAASDPITWAGHPIPDRWKPEVFNPYFDALLASGETLAAVLNDEIIGCSRFHTPPEDLSRIALGYTFLNHVYWGGTMNRRMKALMLNYAFETHDPVWVHIAPDNIRSQKATARHGAVFVERSLKELGGTVSDWMASTLSQTDWAASAQC